MNLLLLDELMPWHVDDLDYSKLEVSCGCALYRKRGDPSFSFSSACGFS